MYFISSPLRPSLVVSNTHFCAWQAIVFCFCCRIKRGRRERGHFLGFENHSIASSPLGVCCYKKSWFSTLCKVGSRREELCRPHRNSKGGFSLCSLLAKREWLIKAGIWFHFRGWRNKSVDLNARVLAALSSCFISPQSKIGCKNLLPLLCQALSPSSQGSNCVSWKHVKRTFAADSGSCIIMDGDSKRGHSKDNNNK